MRCYKNVKDGYILAIGIGGGHTEIDTEEYARIMEAVRNRPTPPDGYDYRLTEALEWELYELPHVDPDDIEISSDEALSIILGGG